ncbi:MAG TPA: hypothetical protein DCR21_05060 [Succinivibrionaceae bacterium]|nr:hypothetical protein [Succinivibrionaceae bacterium]
MDFKTLSPKNKKILTIVGIGAGLWLVASYISRSQEESREQKPIEYVLTDRDSKALGMESLIAQIKIANDKLTAQEAQNRKLQKDFDALKKEQTEARQSRQEYSRMQQQLQALAEANDREKAAINEQMKKLTAENERLNRIINSAPKIDTDGDGIDDTPDLSGGLDDPAKPYRYRREDVKPTSNRSEEDLGYDDQPSGSSFTTDRKRGSEPLDRKRGGESSVSRRGSDSRDSRGSTSASVDSAAPNRRLIDTSVNIADPYALYEELGDFDRQGVPTMDAGETVLQAPAPTKIAVISEYKDPAVEAARMAKRKHDLYIPVGSMLKGVLLTGLYAPTGANSRKDPFPVVLRVQDEMIMPNLRRADLRECFLTLSGYGDLSSERAMMRGETISCIANDNSILETTLASYAVGEDGKAGVRGKLIVRNGKALRNAMLAGFASGLGNAFQTQSVPKLDISGSSSTTYTSAFSAKSLNNGLFSGASSALEKLADYYMKMADQTLPVIEIAAGREITVAVTAGTDLKTKRDADGNPVSTSGRGSGTGVTQPRQVSVEDVRRENQRALNDNISTAAAATAQRAAQ